MPRIAKHQTRASFFYFSLIFLFEMLIKQTGMGLKRYFADPFNDLDFVIVVTSCADIIHFIKKESM